MDEAPLQIDVAPMSDLWDEWPEAEDIARRAMSAVARHPSVRLGPDAEVTLALADDQTVRGLNRDYRGQDKATNVLSFPAARGPMLGDIIIAFETLLKEAATEGLAREAHLAHLTVHGLLHLLGHDHDTEERAMAMETLETALLAGLGYADPHAGGRVMPGG